MSKQRYIDTKFWIDNYIVDKDPVEKLLFLYLLTNHLTNICGIYEINIRQIAFDTGIDKEMVLKILDRFEDDGKIKYKDGYIAIKNFIRYQHDNPKIRAGISYELQNKPSELVEWVETSDYKPTERKFKRKKISKILRKKILEKYNYQCVICGSKENLEIDHIVPVFMGGKTEESNLRVLCQSCNGKRNAGLRWDKEKNGWTMDNTPNKMGSLSHPNPNPNSNINPNLNSNINNIYTYWNNQKIIVHRNIDKYKSTIKTALNNYSEEELITAITNYKIILSSEDYILDKKWELNEFLRRKIDRFLDLEAAKSFYKNYKKGDYNGKSKGYNQRDNTRADGQGGSGEDKYKHLEETYEV